MTVKERTRLIRNATPDVLEELFEMQNRICDLCEQPIQDLILAELEHSVPVSRFAKSELPIDEAIRQAHAPSNLRAAHVHCNHVKRGRTRDEWFALGLNRKVGNPKNYSDKELETFRIRLSIGGRKQGVLSFKNRTGIHADGFDRIGTARKGGLRTQQLHPEIASNLGRRTRLFYPGMAEKNGRLAGSKHKRNGTGIFSLTKEQKLAACSKGGFKNVESGHLASIQSAGGKVSGKMNVENNTGICGMSHKEHIAAGYKSSHVRWHVKRGVLNPKCKLCVASRGTEYEGDNQSSSRHGNTRMDT